MSLQGVAKCADMLTVSSGGRLNKVVTKNPDFTKGPFMTNGLDLKLSREFELKHELDWIWKKQWVKSGQKDPYFMLTFIRNLLLIIFPSG